jgi:3-oxoacyl-(acyl-carrier-protein) synthase
MNVRVFIVGVGLISPLGAGFGDNLAALKEGRTGIAPLSLFPTPRQAPLPVGEIRDVPRDDRLPRTHVLAGMAAAEALRGANERPDAVIMGVITGGMPVTETLLKDGVRDPGRYRHHSTGSVAEHIAREVGCAGPVLTVSTACSSGTVALKLSLEMLRSGRSNCVLAGGVDALCRLTYYGFSALQLVDPAGARPLDRSRRGMTVGEGAALLLLVAGEEPPDHALAELLGVGLSCDAYHAAAPRPDGSGACRAMREALSDAGVAPFDIDYIHLHGTGTVDNDLAEARALHTLFGDRMPRLSSTKGATGHALGAAGAIGAAISVMSIGNRLIPASSGCAVPDPELKLHPVMAPLAAEVRTVLSNAFGFGGNNAALVTGRPGKSILRRDVRQGCDFFNILGSACLTGAGNADATLANLRDGKPVRGVMNPDAMTTQLPPRDLRRLKRLSRSAQSLALAAHRDAATTDAPSSVFFGTGWGPLSDMHDFLVKLFESNEQFTSPTDFVGSVHNAAAGQVAIRFDARGPNVTMTGGDYSFEQALLSAGLLAPDPEARCLLIAADEYHPVLSKLFDPSAALSEAPADGGAAFCLGRGTAGRGLRLSSAFLQYARGNPRAVHAMVDNLAGEAAIGERYGAVFAGIPMAQREQGRRQLKEFLSLTDFSGGVVDYRRWTGEYAAASAVAACCAARFVKEGTIPELPGHAPVGPLHGKGILLLGLGDFVTAVGILP